MPTINPKKTFSELIQEEESILTRLFLLSSKQLEIVRDGNITKLLDFLIRKQSVVNEFEQINALLKPFRDIPPEDRQWSSERERQRTEESLERCKEFLEQIVANDELSTGELVEQKYETGRQLRELKKSATVNASYAKQAVPVVTQENVRRLDLSR